MEINKPIGSVIIFIISLILIFLLVQPKYSESSLLQASLDQKSQEYRSKSAYYEKVVETIQKIESKKDSLDKISSALPEELYFSPLIYFLDKKITETGLVNRSLIFSQGSSSRFTSAAENRETKNISFSLTLSGTYDGLKNFLYALEKSSRIFEVSTISFASSRQDIPQAGLENYDFKLEVLTHTY